MLRPVYILFSIFYLLTLTACKDTELAPPEPSPLDPFQNEAATQDDTDLDSLLNGWHGYAAKGEFEKYFEMTTEDFHFLGTDASEDWEKDEFMQFSKPHFADGEAWTFKPLRRNIYKREVYAHFDEMLNSDHMGLCRGSGVLVKKEDGWKIDHYVLSILVPNENVSELMKIKREPDSIFSTGF